MTLRMGDAIHPENIPPGLDAVAGYVDGRWPDYQAEMQRFPNAHHLSISVFASDNADCLDIENGDATNAQAPAWVPRQRARGATRPCLYTSLSNAQALVRTLDQAAVPRASYRLWTAHYDPNLGPHTCKPSCGLGFTDAADGTQWTDHGGAWDESQLADDFFDTPAPTDLIKEETMQALIGENWELIIVGEAKDNGNTLVMRVPRNPDGSLGHPEAIDITDGVGKDGAGREYRVV